MNGLTNDEIVIDSNVFQHMVTRDAQFNADGHIGELLARLQADQIRLCVDNRGRITGEYLVVLEPILRNASDEGEEILTLRYWMLEEIRVYEPFDNTGPLMAAIKTVIVERKENVDRTLVSVSFSRGQVLLSNDLSHIVDGPENRPKKVPPRRDALMNAARKLRKPGAEILTSREAQRRI
jgi:hypothetical protein